MENKINIAILLKNCPTGMKLDSPMYDNLYFDKVEEDYGLPISCYTIYHGNKTAVYFTEFGSYNTHKTAKCVIFPKGKTTWEGFVPPFKFKDGDILFVEAIYDWIFIYKENENKENLYKHVATNFSELVYDDIPLCNREYVKEIRFATEEEKRKLFNAIKANGYRWNAETKTLETLIKPKFKIGDKVRHKNNHGVVFTITNIEEDYYTCGAELALWFDDQDKYELVPNKFDITTLKPFDKVLIRDNNSARWDITFYELYDNKNKSYPYRTLGGNIYKYCIPYEGNEHLLGKTDDCKDFYKTW